MNYIPLVIIGAPRSGTNMLRDVLTRFPGVATWPCDEINYIWRHGNLRYPSDELPAEFARPSVKQYVRRKFEWVARQYDADLVVEKTCANSLRIPFVDRVVPEARYIFIYRDGLDAVGSAIARWKAPLDISYLARKARFVPVTDLAWYASRYLGSRLHRLFSRERRVGLWGPKLDDMDKFLAEYPLDEVCALQWHHCVKASAEAFASMSSDRWLQVRYEDFVRDPEGELSRIVDFAGIQVHTESRRAAVAGISTSSLGKGRAALGDERVRRLEPLIADAMKPLEKGL